MQYKYDKINLAAVGALIQAVRKERGFTQQTLSEKLGIGLKYLSEIECGKSTPSYPLIVAIADTLEVTVEFLTYGADKAAEDQIDNNVLFYIPEAKGITEEQHRYLQLSFRDIAKNLKASTI